MKIAETPTVLVTASWKDKDHPWWELAKILLTGLVVGVLLALNATNFDEGEVITIVGTVFGAGGIHALKWHRKGRRVVRRR